MTIIVVERASLGLRGQLTRWMIEVRAGVFVGTLSSRVREKLWTLTQGRNPKGGSLLVYRAQNEQGFIIESDGDTSREVIDMEGLLLVRRPWDDAAQGGKRRRLQHSSASLDLQKTPASK